MTNTEKRHGLWTDADIDALDIPVIGDAPEATTANADGSALLGLPRLRPLRCNDHPAYDADYCPVCGTARVIR